MSYDPLVSESESSSGEGSPSQAQSISHTPLSEDSLNPTRSQSPVPSSLSRKSLNRSGSVQPDNTTDRNDDDNDSDNANIQNEELPCTKVTLSASVMLSRLPPDSSRVISRATEPNNEKITIRCQAIGSAPQLTPNIFKISYHQPFATLIKFLTKKLKKKLPNKNDVLYCYVNNSFAPSPDEIVGHLYRHFAVNRELVVSYCTVVAFG
ncbi:CYFA0S06e00628g1_1 [Cyberlindnera fabianii]|uniref:Ubiquitin-like protein ATG12 n=1 Tax=Cyberlindnera fabianii TaxID=36022 RepID=A0A061AV51_CYBFA|nr:CYFA0S06e00628g1_1 [Cyberlindnera fabianii]